MKLCNDLTYLLYIGSWFKAYLHIPTPSPIPSPSSFIIVQMVTFCLTCRMGLEPILPIRWPVTISTMFNFDGVGIGDGVGMCNQAFTSVCTTMRCFGYLSVAKGEIKGRNLFRTVVFLQWVGQLPQTSVGFFRRTFWLHCVYQLVCCHRTWEGA